MTSAVLVTGATGFVGREVARRLLAEDGRVLVLARGRDGVPAGARARGALGVAPDDRRVTVVEGDLAAPACGLANADGARLYASVETVIHCAGDTAFAPDRPAPYEAAHVDGPCRLLERLAAGRLRRWVHVSTAYVCGRRSGLILESEGDVGQAFHNAYERVKLAAESALRAAGRRAGVDVRVARPGVVVGPAPETAGGTPSNLFFAFIRMTAALASLAGERPLPLRIEAAPDAPFNLVPVDFVAPALVHLARASDGDGETVHLVARDAPRQDAVLALITGRLGVRGLSLVETLERPTPLERRVARMLEPYRSYLAQRLVFDDAGARTLLPAGLLPRAALSPATLHALIDLALTTAGASPAVAAR